jgi:hypothetical protein
MGLEWNPVLLLRPFIGLLYQPWMKDNEDCGAVSVMSEWQGKPKYSEGTSPCVHCRSHMTSPGLEPGPPLWEAGDQPPEVRHGPGGEGWRSTASSCWSHSRLHASITSLRIPFKYYCKI